MNDQGLPNLFVTAKEKAGSNDKEENDAEGDVSDEEEERVYRKSGENINFTLSCILGHDLFPPLQRCYNSYFCSKRCVMKYSQLHEELGLNYPTKKPKHVRIMNQNCTKRRVFCALRGIAFGENEGDTKEGLALKISREKNEFSGVRMKYSNFAEMEKAQEKCLWTNWGKKNVDTNNAMAAVCI